MTDAARPYRQSGYVVRAVEAGDYLIGIYGPYSTLAEAEAAAIAHNRDGIKTDVMPLHAPSAMGSW